MAIVSLGTSSRFRAAATAAKAAAVVAGEKSAVAPVSASAPAWLGRDDNGVAAGSEGQKRLGRANVKPQS